jgi:hypothetical protein
VEEETGVEGEAGAEGWRWWELGGLGVVWFRIVVVTSVRRDSREVSGRKWVLGA